MPVPARHAGQVPPTSLDCPEVSERQNAAPLSDAFEVPSPQAHASRRAGVGVQDRGSFPACRTLRPASDGLPLSVRPAGRVSPGLQAASCCAGAGSQDRCLELLSQDQCPASDGSQGGGGGLRCVLEVTGLEPFRVEGARPLDGEKECKVIGEENDKEEEAALAPRDVVQCTGAVLALLA